LVLGVLLSEEGEAEAEDASAIEKDLAGLLDAGMFLQILK
jgi:hypothetical protein